MPTDRRTLTGALLFLMIGAIVFFHGLIPLRLPGIGGMAAVCC